MRTPRGYFVRRQNTTGKKGERSMASVHFQIPGCFGGLSREGKETLIQIPDKPPTPTPRPPPALGLGLPVGTTASDLRPGGPSGSAPQPVFPRPLW